MPDYSQGKIYTIRCKNDTSLIYVGSTIQPLAKRWGGHKCKSLNNPEQLIYKTINNNWDNWYIELYELYPCNSKAELCKREGEVIRELGNLNYEIAGRTPKEYYEENKDKILERQKEYREDNKEKILERQKEYYEENKEKILEKVKEYRENNKEKIQEYHKEYRENNKEKIQEYHKEYRENNKEIISEKNKEYRKINKEIISEKNKEKFTCNCGSTLRLSDKSQHLKTKKHINYLAIIEG